jgi:hypothetical protein
LGFLFIFTSKRYSMKVFIPFILIFLAFIKPIFSQSLFSNVYYNPAPEDILGMAMVPVPGKGSLIAGFEGFRPGALANDAAGNLLWTKTYGNDGAFYYVTATSDSSYIMGGMIYNNSQSERNLYLVKINKQGDTLWTREFDMGRDEQAYCIRETFGKGLVVCGISYTNYVNYYYNSDYPGSDMVVLVLDSVGHYVNGTRIHSGNYINTAYSVRQLPDSGFVLTGNIGDTLSGALNLNYFLMKMNPTLGIEWLKRQSGLNNDRTRSYVAEVCDSGIYSLVSTTYNGMIMLKTGFNGQVMESVKYNILSSYGDAWANDRILLKNNHLKAFSTRENFMLADTSGVSIHSLMLAVSQIQDFYALSDSGFIFLTSGPLILTKYNGELEIGYMKTDTSVNNFCYFGYSTVQTSAISLNFTSPSYTVTTAGTSVVALHPVTDYYVITRTGCLDIQGNIRSTPLKNENFSVSPNPVYHKFVIHASDMSPTCRLKLFAITGECVFNQESVQTETEISLPDLKPGLYYMRIGGEGNETILKIVVLN